MRQHCLMAKMNTVKGANRHRTAAVTGTQIMPAADELHRGFSPCHIEKRSIPLR
jgi:hypothetical protein